MIINDITGQPENFITPQSNVVQMSHQERISLTSVSGGDIIYQTDTVGNSTMGLYLCTGSSPSIEWLSFGTWDQNGQVPISRLPATLLGDLNYRGAFDATIAVQVDGEPLLTRQLVDPVGKNGYFFVCQTPSPTTGGTPGYSIGDWAISNGLTYDRLSASDMFDKLPMTIKKADGTAVTYHIPVYK